MKLALLALVVSAVTLSTSSFAIDEEWLKAVQATPKRENYGTYQEWLDAVNGNHDQIIQAPETAPKKAAPSIKTVPRLIVKGVLGDSYYARLLTGL